MLRCLRGEGLSSRPSSELQSVRRAIHEPPKRGACPTEAAKLRSCMEVNLPRYTKARKQHTQTLRSTCPTQAEALDACLAFVSTHPEANMTTCESQLYAFTTCVDAAACPGPAARFNTCIAQHMPKGASDSSSSVESTPSGSSPSTPSTPPPSPPIMLPEEMEQRRSLATTVCREQVRELEECAVDYQLAALTRMGINVDNFAEGSSDEQS
jgi:hypothetical protein